MLLLINSSAIARMSAVAVYILMLRMWHGMLYIQALFIYNLSISSGTAITGCLPRGSFF